MNFKPGDMLRHKLKSNQPPALVLGNYDVEVPSKMPPKYERRVCILHLGNGAPKLDSLKELDLMIDWQILFRQVVEDGVC